MKKSFILINRFNQRFWKRIVDSTFLPPQSLSAFRVVTGVFLLILYLPSFSWIATMPQTFFNPPVLSVVNFLEYFPGETFFLILDIIIFLSLVCLTLGIKARLSSLLFLVSCLAGLHFQYSFGKIAHVILPYVLIGCMAFSGWGRYLALVADKKSRWDNTAKSLSLLGVLVCFGMFTAGFEKALVWVDFDLSQNGFLNWSRQSIFVSYKNYLFAPYIEYFPSFLLESFDYTAVVFELSPLLFLLHSKKAWNIWLLIACCFHFINTLLLNVPFPLHSIVYLVFIDFTWLYEKIKRLSGSSIFKIIATLGIVSIVVIQITSIISGQSLTSILVMHETEILLNLYLSLLIWGISMALIYRSLLRPSVTDLTTQKQD